MIRKYKFYLGEKIGYEELENDYMGADYAPIRIGGNDDTLETLQEKYKGADIHQRTLNLFDINSRTSERVTYYYVKATAIDKQEYKDLDSYDCELPPKNPIVELTFQCEDSVAKAYVTINNHNCTFMDLWDIAIDQVMDKPQKYVPGSYLSEDEEEPTLYLRMHDKGGWEDEICIDIDNYSEKIKNYIVGMRLVEKVKKAEA